MELPIWTYDTPTEWEEPRSIYDKIAEALIDHILSTGPQGAPAR